MVIGSSHEAVMSLIARIMLKVIRPYVAKMQRMRHLQFRALPRANTDLLFLGDSITEFGLWSEWFSDRTVANRGVAGDVSQGVLDRLELGVSRHQKVFLLIGTNDLTCGVPIHQIAANVEAIVKRLLRTNPDTEIFLQSVMPRAPSYQGRIEALNTEYRRVATMLGVAYVDLWPVFADGSGGIRSDYSMDQLHLTGEAYRVWAEKLRPYAAATEHQENWSPQGNALHP